MKKKNKIKPMKKLLGEAEPDLIKRNKGVKLSRKEDVADTQKKKLRKILHKLVFIE